MRTNSPLERVVSLPENRSVLTALQDLACCLISRGRPLVDLLFVHGPTGTGKTCLVTAFADAVCTEATDTTVVVLSANDFPLPWEQDETLAQAERYEEACRSDVLIVEDLQHLPARAHQPITHLLDRRSANSLATVVTASLGPALLGHRGKPLPGRLTNRLAGGLVVGLQPFAPPARLAFLQEISRRRNLAISADILGWLAEVLGGGGRQLEGALHRVEAMAKLNGKPPTLDELRAQLHVEVHAGRPSVDRISRRVNGHFGVTLAQVQSSRRQPSILLPRQIGMYLARQLTGLSLQEIGAHFGGRDHSTVLHSCRKVDRAMRSDIRLASAVRQLQAELAC